jgi:hypothetical protein
MILLRGKVIKISKKGPRIPAIAVLRAKYHTEFRLSDHEQRYARHSRDQQ